MKHLFLYIILSISFFNCSNLKKETSKNLNFKNQIQNKDISDILNSNSSIEIYAYLSINSYREERDIITKKRGKVFIHSYYSESSLLEHDLGVVEYKKVLNDSLNFEDFFRNLNKKDTIKTSDNRLNFQVIYQSDTTNYYTDGLYDLITNTGFYLYIKQRLYNDSKAYKSLIPREKIKF